MRVSVVTLCRYIPYQILFSESQYSIVRALLLLILTGLITLPYLTLPVSPTVQYAAYTVYLCLYLLLL